MTNREFYNPQFDPDEPISMSACGCRYCGSNLFFSGIRQEYTLHYVLSGRGWYEIDNKRYEVKSGDTFATFPDILLSFGVDESDPWLLYWVNFHGTKAAAYCGIAGISIKNPVVHHINDTFIKNIDEYLDTVMDKNCFYSELLPTACLFNCLAEIERTVKTSEPQEASHKLYVSNAIAYMEHHYWEQIRISSLAKYLGIEKSYLYRIFKKETNVSPVEYLMNLRIEKAKYLIRQGYNFQETATSVGINDIFYFSKLFKKVTGYSPSEFRRSFKQ